MDKILVTISGISALIFAVITGFYTYRTKKLELKIKEAEADRTISEAQKEKNNIIQEEKRDKALDSKLDTRINLVIERQEGTNTIIATLFDEISDVKKFVSEMNNKLDVHCEKDDFITDISFWIQSTVNKIFFFHKSTNTDENYGNKYNLILFKWASTIEKYGINYFKIKARHTDKKNLRNELRQQMELFINDFYVDVESSIPEIIQEGTKYSNFKQLLEQTNIHKHSHILVEKLADNGFTIEGYTDYNKIKDIFVNHVNDFFSAFFTSSATWDLWLITNNLKCAKR